MMVYKYSDQFIGIHHLSFIWDSVSETRLCLCPWIKYLLSWAESLELVPISKDSLFNVALKLGQWIVSKEVIVVFSSLLCFQESTINLSPDPDESNPPPYNLFLYDLY
jgi:hypothetical protein